MHTTTPPSGEGSHSGRASRTPAWSHLFLPVHRWLYRRTGGAIGHHLGIQRALLLTTTGRHSGQPRTQPLAYFTQEGQTFVVASNWGNDRPPAWYLNLQAEPRVQVQLGRRIFDATAAIASPEERSRLWPRLIARSPNFARYQELAAREIPLVLLHPEPSAR